ncbi:M23 family metallopeptidase [Streptomyces sp. NPDC007088]|uniref:M23 family metallopeptidase n=1 Tax=Streptomyces sp. NPDC007088 TaxID=3364773 RepID=UPI0036792A54
MVSCSRSRALRRSLVVPSLCLLLAGVLGVSRPPVDAADGPETPSAEVAALYRRAAQATEQYESGRKAAAAEKVRAAELEERLKGQRGRLVLLQEDVGRIAREQYRSHDDGLSIAANLLLADDPDGLLRSTRMTARADLAVTHLVDRTRLASAKLLGDEREARKRWKSLERRNAQLAVLKAEISAKLQTARQKLQAEADSSVTAGKCRGAVRLAQAVSEVPRGPWVKPVAKYVVSARFGGSGERWSHQHTGQDFAVDVGTPVSAAGAGRVVRVSCGGPFGIEVVVQHEGGYYTQYAHLSSAAVDQGQRVGAGQWIGQSGTTGNSTGPHLHFEVRLTPDYGSALDPVPWLKEHGVTL